jgi:alpha-mannosidase
MKHGHRTRRNLLGNCFQEALSGRGAVTRRRARVTRGIINADLQPTASFVINPDIDFELGAMQDSLRGTIGEQKLDVLEATGIATALMGDSIAEYEATILRHIANIKPVQIPTIRRIAEVPEIIRGYGHIKDQSIEKAAAERARLESDLSNNSFAIAAE